MMILTEAADYWRSLSRTVKVIGYFGVVSAAIVSGAQAVPYIEPYWYAHRGYVRYYDHDQLAPILKRLAQVQLQQDSDRRERLLDEAKKRELELQDPTVKATPAYEALVQDRVERIKSELDKLDKDDKSLFDQPLSK